MQTIYVIISKDNGKVLTGTRPYTSMKKAEAAMKASNPGWGDGWRSHYAIVPYVPQEGADIL